VRIRSSLHRPLSPRACIKADGENDLLLGFTIYSIVSINTTFLARHFQSAIQIALVQWPVEALAWLDDWPVGLKLNTPLSHFYRTSLSTGIAYWAGESSLCYDVYCPHVSLHAQAPRNVQHAMHNTC
jgi:hypothetical protein